MKIYKLTYDGSVFYPATITSAVKDINFLKDDNSPMTQTEINLYFSEQFEGIEDILKIINGDEYSQ